MDIHSIRTPALLLDLARVRRNAAAMKARAAELGVTLRPHVKTHKCIEVGRLQTAGQSGAITVSTLAEARAFAAEGFTDILYAVPIIPSRIPEALTLSEECDRFIFLTDSSELPPLLEDGARAAGIVADVAVKIDCGYGRCGVARPSAAIELVRAIAARPSLRFFGLVTHAGHAYKATALSERRRIAAGDRDVILEIAELLRRDGIEVPNVSVGSTPSITAVDHLEGVDEVRPGNYIFFDEFQAAIGTCKPADCALSVLASVLHLDAANGKLVLDCGAIALSKDPGAPGHGGDVSYGRVLDVDGVDLGLRVTSLSQEHGLCRTEGTEVSIGHMTIGSRVRVSPNHACLTAAQHPVYHVLADGEITDQWLIHGGW